MRIRISHETVYNYDQPPNGVIQNLRLTPRNHDGQFVIDWRVDVSQDCRLDEHEDAFGNISHAFTADGPFSTLSVRVDGEVETQDTNGFVKGAVERFPPSLFLRETPLTMPDPGITAFAEELRALPDSAETLGLMHTLMDRLHEDITYDTDPTNTGTTAAEAFTLKRGVCQDATHIFLAVARTLGVPARYVGGYFHRADGVTAQEAGHAWAEAFVTDYGWIAFDPTNGMCATDAHVRVAIGLDYLGAAPVRGTRYGGGAETMSIAVQVDQAGRQTQS
ncbi:MAG: transglutaminase [Bradyrhizobium sp.]|nr:transglutaminase [Bradyrhizobium sp.]